MTIGGSFKTHDAAVVSVAERVVAIQDGVLSEMEPLVRGTADGTSPRGSRVALGRSAS